MVSSSACWGQAFDLVDEAQRVERCVRVPVIVEIDEYVRAAGEPGRDVVRPLVELRVGVAAGVELFRAVQPRVGKVGGAMDAARKFSRAVGGDQGDALP
jgi:hypothetical protein